MFAYNREIWSCRTGATRDQARALMRVLIGERLHGQSLHTRSILMELNEL